MSLAKIKSHWSRVGPQSQTTGVLIKRGSWDKDMDTPHEDEGEDRGMLPHAKEQPKTANKSPEARGEAWNRFSDSRSEREPTLPTP